MSDPFLGQIITTAFNFAPLNFALCDGAALMVRQQAALFSLLSNSFGGDGVTTFNLPDLRGRAMMGWGVAPGGTSYPRAKGGGVENVTLSDAQVPPHMHLVNANSAAGTASPVGNIYSSTGSTTAIPTTNVYAVPGDPSTLVPLANQALAEGGGGPHSNMQPFLVVNMMIAMLGAYPPRG